MKPTNQTTSDDCFRACIASLLEVEITDIPDDYIKAEDNWLDVINEWMNKRGLQLVRVPAMYFDFTSKFHYIMTGKSYRDKESSHAVIGYAGKVIHDPHESKKGLNEQIYSVYIICCLNPSKYSFNYMEFSEN